MAIGLLGVSGSVIATDSRAGPLPTEARCLALVAYAEAVGEGRKGMAAVIGVMDNRIRDRRFPKDACAVARQKGQFQAVAESRRYRRALQAPHRMSLARTLKARTAFERKMLRQAAELARNRRHTHDPTGGALYFVNPQMMDPSRCAWFAKLKRTKTIGRHVFMTHYRKGERRRGPALDCRRLGQGWNAARTGAIVEDAPVPKLKVRQHVPIPMPKPATGATVLALRELRLAR